MAAHKDTKEAALASLQIQVNQDLLRLSADDQGIESLARALTQFSHKAVLIQDKRLQPLAVIPSNELPDLTAILQELQDPNCLPSELLDRKQAYHVTEPIAQAHETYSRLILPIVTRNVARGYVSFLTPLIEGKQQSRFDARDRVILAQGALVAAIEMAKVKAVSVAEQKLRGDLIQAVLAQAITEADALGWAERAGFRKAGPYAALTMQWLGAEAPSLRRLETIVSGQVRRQRGRMMASARENEIVVWYALTPNKLTAEAESWAQTILNLAHSEFPRARLAIGIGRPVERLLALRDSYREAEQAMSLEQRLQHRKPQVYANLGVYRLLLPLAETSELKVFSEQVLGKLMDHERGDKTNLLETLRVYFENNGNVAKTAQALFVHRNTLLYRLDRIKQVGSFDLDNAETRLQLQLAIRAYELTRRD